MVSVDAESVGNDCFVIRSRGGAAGPSDSIEIIVAVNDSVRIPATVWQQTPFLSCAHCSPLLGPAQMTCFLSSAHYPCELCPTVPLIERCLGYHVSSVRFGNSGSGLSSEEQP